MGKAKTTQSNSVDPWIPTQGEFDRFKRYGQGLMTDRFRSGLEQAQGTLAQAGQQASPDAGVSGVYSQLMDGGYGTTQGFQRAVGSGLNATVDPSLQSAAAQAQGGLDPQFDRTTGQAQGREFAGGFQNTLAEMMDPAARSAAFGQVKQNVANDVMRGVNSTFAGSGMTGSSLHKQNLAKGLASGLASVENDAFQQSQARALSAAQIGQGDLMAQRQLGLGAAQARQGAAADMRAQGLAGAAALQGAGMDARAQAMQAAAMDQGQVSNIQNTALAGAQAMQGAGQQGFANLLGLSGQQAGLGQQWQNAYQSGVQGLMGTAVGGAAQTSTQSQSPGLAGILGAGLQVASLFSDERLKEDKKRVGEMDDGTPVYTYRYKEGAAPAPELEGKTMMGVLAQKVKKKAAVEDDPSGFKRVNYGAL